MQLAAQRRHYHRNAETIKARVQKNNVKLRIRNREFVNNIKSTTPCTDCGVIYPPYVMQFDHIVDGKRASIAHMVRAAVSIQTIQTEIEKCELVCANCHAERTHSRMVEGEEGLSEWL